MPRQEGNLLVWGSDIEPGTIMGRMFGSHGRALFVLVWVILVLFLVAWGHGPTSFLALVTLALIIRALTALVAVCLVAVLGRN